MKRLAIELPDEALPALGLSPAEAEREACLVLAIHWYAQGRLSQGTAARLAGLSRADFLVALGAAKVPAIQITADELREDVGHGIAADRQR